MDPFKRELKLSRYELVKNVFFDTKNIGKAHYDRLSYTLKKWASLTVVFEGIFYEGDSYTYRIFHIIEDVILDKQSKELLIRFNQQYIQQLQETKFYKLIDYHEYKKLTKPISARLYEILIKNFKDRNGWHIGIINLAEKLTLQRHYPSDILIKIKPALTEINKKTELKIEFDYDKENQLCTFKKIKKESITQEQIQDAQEVEIINILLNFGITKSKAEFIYQEYNEDKIRHKINLLKQNKQAISNVAGWLIRALEEDWESAAYDKQLEEQKIKEEHARKLKEQEEQEKKLQTFKKEHDLYIAAKVDELYKSLPVKVAKTYDIQYADWSKEQRSKPFG